MANQSITQQERKERQSAYETYRDMGKTRSYDRLIIVLEASHGVLPKNKLMRWSKEDNWKDRVAEYDRAANPALVDQHVHTISTDPEYDRMDALLRASHLALQRVLSSNPTVRSPQDYKTLVDAAEKAIRMVEKLRELGIDHGPAGDVDKRANLATTMLNELRQAVKDKFAAMGTPVQRLVLDEHGQRVIDPPREQPMIDVTPKEPVSAPVEIVVSAEPVGTVENVMAAAAKLEAEPVSANDDMTAKSAIGDTPKPDDPPKTMAERLARMKR